MSFVNVLATAGFLVAFLAVALVLRRLGIERWRFPLLVGLAGCWAALSSLGSNGFLVHVVATWLMGLPPGGLWHSIMFVAVISPAVEEASRLVLLLVVLAYCAEKDWSTWKLGLTVGLCWGLAEFFLKTLGFALPLVGIDPMPLLKGIAMVGVPPENAPFLVAGRMAVVAWHGAFAVMMLHGIRTRNAECVLGAYGLHALANAVATVGHYFDPSFVANFSTAALIAVLLVLFTRRLVRQDEQIGEAPEPVAEQGTRPLAAP